MTFNLAERACYEELTIEEVNRETKEKLEDNKYAGYRVLYWASAYCPVEVVEAILDKGVDIDAFSDVRNCCIVVTYYYWL
jgi:hypothetical protein